MSRKSAAEGAVPLGPGRRPKTEKAGGKPTTFLAERLSYFWNGPIVLMSRPGSSSSAASVIVEAVTTGPSCMSSYRPNDVGHSFDSG